VNRMSKEEWMKEFVRVLSTTGFRVRVERAVDCITMAVRPTLPGLRFVASELEAELFTPWGACLARVTWGHVPDMDEGDWQEWVVGPF